MPQQKRGPVDLRGEIIEFVSHGNGDRDRLKQLIDRCKAEIDGDAILVEARRNCNRHWHALAKDLEKAIKAWQPPKADIVPPSADIEQNPKVQAVGAVEKKLSIWKMLFRRSPARAKTGTEQVPLPTSLKWPSGGCWSYSSEEPALEGFDKVRTAILAFKKKDRSVRQSQVKISLWEASRNVQYPLQLLVTSSRYWSARHGIGTVAGKRQVVSEYSPDEGLMNLAGDTLADSSSYDSCTPESYERYVTMCGATIMKYARL